MSTNFNGFVWTYENFAVIFSCRHRVNSLIKVQLREVFYFSCMQLATQRRLDLKVTRWSWMVKWELGFAYFQCWELGFSCLHLVCVPDPNIIWVCKTRPILYSDVTILYSDVTDLFHKSRFCWKALCAKCSSGRNLTKFKQCCY